MTAERVSGNGADPRGAVAARDSDPRKNPRENPNAAQLILLFVLYCLRLLSLSLVLPVLAPYARDLRGSTAAWTGLAVGVYGLTQGIFQVPFGAASDRYGRKRILALGLVVFAVGCAICASADSIYALLAGRFLQGAGAVASTLLAFVADLTDEESRPQAMAWLGTIIGISFGLGVIGGPVLTHNFGLPAVFWGSGVLCLLGAVAAMLFLPEPPRARQMATRSAKKVRAPWRTLLHEGTLVRLSIQVFLLHFTLTALFVVVPLRMVHAVNPRDLWLAYVPVILAGLVMMFVAASLQKKFPRPDLFVLFGWAAVAAGTYLALNAPARRAPVVTALVLFVSGFAVLEPLLPSLFTRLARTSVRGAALGLFNGGQFMGAFIGGLTAGALVEKAPHVLALLVAGLAGASLLLLKGLRSAAFLRVAQFSVLKMSDAEEAALADRIRLLRGVRDVSIDADEWLWVQCDTRETDERELKRVVEGA